jgi:hypothetical protein
MIRHVAILLLVLIACLPVVAKVTNCPSGDLHSVTNCIEAPNVVDGDIVKLPHGEFEWCGSGCTYIFTKNITLQGARPYGTLSGFDPNVDTIVTLSITNSPGFNYGGILMQPAHTNVLQAILEMTFTTDTNNPFPGTSTGIISMGHTGNNDHVTGYGYVNGTPGNIRIGYCTITNNAGDGLILACYDIWGLIDHCWLDMTNETASILVHVENGYWGTNNASWGTGTNNYGDGSWVDQPYWGSGKFLFFEDDVFRNGGFDGKYGCRYVCRYCRMTNSAGWMTVHGSEEQGIRGGREVEAYCNDVFRSSDFFFGTLGQMRSGSIIAFSNHISGGYNSYEGIEDYRQFLCSGSLGASSGYNPYDSNDVAGVIWTGTYLGTNITIGFPGVSSITFPITNNPLFVANQWTTNNGWFVLNDINLTNKYAIGSPVTNACASIISNGTNSITINGGASVGAFAQYFCITNGDTVQIRHVMRGLDMGSAGGGGTTFNTLIVNGVAIPMPIAYSGQTNESCYEWSNTASGTLITSGFLFAGTDQAGSIRAGIDIISQVQKPGYTPFTYPHPFVTSATNVSGTCPNIVNATNGIAITPASASGSGGYGGPYTFTASGLPSGLSMDSSGNVTGTPSAAGTTSYSITVSDASSYTNIITCSVTVNQFNAPPAPPPAAGAIVPCPQQ